MQLVLHVHDSLFTSYEQFEIFYNIHTYLPTSPLLPKLVSPGLCSASSFSQQSRSIPQHLVVPTLGCYATNGLRNISLQIFLTCVSTYFQRFSQRLVNLNFFESKLNRFILGILCVLYLLSFRFLSFIEFCNTLAHQYLPYLKKLCVGLQVDPRTKIENWVSKETGQIGSTFRFVFIPLLNSLPLERIVFFSTCSGQLVVSRNTYRPLR